METSATIYQMMVEGKTEDEIMDELGMDVATFRDARRFMLELKTEDIRLKPREHVYVEYCIAQEKNLYDLNDLLEKSRSETKQYNAAVGAIRLRSDILNKMIEVGQEFGLIKKEPVRKEILAGLVVGELSNDDLKQAVRDQIVKLNKLVSDFGDGDIMSMKTGPLHYGPTVTVEGEEVETKPAKSARETSLALPPGRGLGSARAKTSKRSAGRRRVRDDATG